MTSNQYCESCERTFTIKWNHLDHRGHEADEDLDEEDNDQPSICPFCSASTTEQG